MQPIMGEPAMGQDLTGIWHQVHDALRAFVTKRVADEAEVDDILQEVFLWIHRKLDSLKDPHKILSWVYQITRHATCAPTRTAASPSSLSTSSKVAVNSARSWLVV